MLKKTDEWGISAIK